ncbi:MATE family efflux transporter [Photobacterium sp. ZSDE20]|uniref:Multidrug resistance protein NorM n=1 Tax=Photobacterium pectinilyticum TaxID=2906793 RepID=A0ABT1N037_9GAMM|nr:MATE family efflux transporter [Photobacterium sp. ZSDE20]MCQ1058024.1 MATE family efflux transporter [Photobacterium sp. ZSDE20]
MLSASPTLKLIISRTLPLTVGLFAIMLVQLVDSVFIGLLGLNQLAVHGMTLPFQTVFVGLQVGIGVAATSIIARALGANQKDKSAVVSTMTVCFGSLLIAMVCLLLWLSSNWVFTAFFNEEIPHAQAVMLQQIFNRYWPVWLLSAFSVAALYLVTCVYRSHGDSKITGMMFVIASLINLILDPLLMFTFEMGITGAALATILGYGTTAVYMIVNARRRQWFSAIDISSETGKVFCELVRTALMTTANQVLPSVSAFMAMLLITNMGTDTMAFWSLLIRFESFAIVFTLALTMSVPPLIGRYLGEGAWHEISDVLMATAKFVVVFHIVIGGVLSLAIPLLSPLISQQDNIQSWFEIALTILPYSYGPLGLCMVAVSAFNALGLSHRALLVTFTRLFILYIPAIWIGVISGSVSHIVIAASVANVLAGVMAGLAIWSTLAKQTQRDIPRSGDVVVS